MASLLVKRVAYTFSRARTIASSSRFFSTKGFEFVQHDTKDECILKYKDNLGSSVARGVVNDAFSPDVSPTDNLARLLNLSDIRIRHVHGTHLFPRWSVTEDNKGLYILQDMIAKDIDDVRESAKEFMKENFSERTDIPKNHKENVKNFSEITDIPENHKENFKNFITDYLENHKKNFKNFSGITDIGEYHKKNLKKFLDMTDNFEDLIEHLNKIDPLLNMFPIIPIMRGKEYAPTGTHYYHVMKDNKEVDQFVESIHGPLDAVKGYNAWTRVYGINENPKALYIFLVLGNQETCCDYGGYALEIFLDDSLYNIRDMKPVSISGKRRVFIPKKKVEGTKAIGGKLIFYCQKKFFKPTPWRPT